MSASTRDGSTSQARSRLLDTATRIFYAEGIHSVGVDRVLAEAQVTRATLYRHFKGKEELILAAGCLFDPALISATFLRGVEGLLRTSTDRAARPSRIAPHI